MSAARHRPRAHADGTPGLVSQLGPSKNTPLLLSVMGALAGDPSRYAGRGGTHLGIHSSIASFCSWRLSPPHNVVEPTGALALVLGATWAGTPRSRRRPTSVARRLPLGNLLVRPWAWLLALPFLHAITHASRSPGPSGVWSSLSPGVQCPPWQSCVLGSVMGLAHSLRDGCRTTTPPIRAGPSISTSRPLIPHGCPCERRPRNSAHVLHVTACSAMRWRCLLIVFAPAPRRSPRRIFCFDQLGWRDEPRSRRRRRTSKTLDHHSRVHWDRTFCRAGSPRACSRHSRKQSGRLSQCAVSSRRALTVEEARTVAVHARRAPRESYGSRWPSPAGQPRDAKRLPRGTGQFP